MTTDDNAARRQSGPAQQERGASRHGLLTWARRVLVIVVVAAAAWQVYRNAPTMWATVRTIPWQATVGSQLAALAAVFVAVLAWRTLVNGLGQPVGILRAAQVNLVGLLGKYVPGSVWAYLLQIELGRRAGLSRARVFTATLVGVGTGMLAAVLYAVAAIGPLRAAVPWIVYLTPVLPVGLVALCPPVLTRLVNLVLAVLRRPRLSAPLRWGMVARSLGYQLLAFGCYGVHLWVLGRSVDATPGALGFLLCAAAMSVGLNAGILAFLVPSGIGVREAVIVAVLVASIPYPEAFAFAIVSRVMLIVADMIGAALAAAAARWGAPLGEHDPPLRYPSSP